MPSFALGGEAATGTWVQVRRVCFGTWHAMEENSRKCGYGEAALRPVEESQLTEVFSFIHFARLYWALCPLGMKKWCRQNPSPHGASLGGGNGTHSSILAWRIPWTEEPGGLQSLGSQRVRRDWRDLARTHVRCQWTQADLGSSSLGVNTLKNISNFYSLPS